MKERDLYPPVRKWLESQGYTVYVERFDCDVIGVRGDEICVVELKLEFSKRLWEQLQDRARWAHFVYCAVPATACPKKFDGLAYHGFGLLLVDGDKARKKRKAMPQPWFMVKQRRYRLKVLSGMESAQDYHCAG